ncbi:Protein PBDC1, partial [Geodia barretti]
GVGGASSAGGVPSTRAEDYSNFVSGIYTSRLSIYILPKGWLGAGMGSKGHPLRRDSFQDSYGRQDEDLYQEFQKKFKGLQVDKISQDDLKSPEAKERWRSFCKDFEGIVKDYNYGTLLRLDSSQDYSKENTILGADPQLL